jgi:hypothetical protein
VKRLAFIALILTVPPAFAVQPQAERSWNISNLRAPVFTAEHLKLQVARDQLIFTDKKHRSLLRIPSDDLLEVLYTPITFSRGKTVAEGTPTSCVGDQMGCGGLVLLWATTALFLMPMHGRSHFIRITWMDRNVEQQLEFEIGKNDYQPLLDKLKDFSGVKYVDLEAEGLRVRKELAQNAPHALPIHLEHPSRLGLYDLPPGEYRLVALDRGEAKADLYLFPPDTALDPASVRAVARVWLSPCDGPDAIEYADNTPRIRRIAANGQWLSFAE